MARLAIARGFLAEYAKLQKDVQSAVDAACARFARLLSPGAPGKAAVQPGRPDGHHPRERLLARCRTGSAGRRHVLPGHGPAPERGERLRGQSPVQRQPGGRGARSPRRGSRVQRLQPSLNTAGPGGGRLFGDVSDADLTWLGVDPNLLQAVRLLTGETDLEMLHAVVPEAQYAALYALASGMTVDEARDEVARLLSAGTRPEQVDPDDLVAAMERTPGAITFRLRTGGVAAHPRLTRSRRGAHSCTRASAKSPTGKAMPARRR